MCVNQHLYEYVSYVLIVRLLSSVTVFLLPGAGKNDKSGETYEHGTATRVSVGN